jgi:hypothetical protein
MAVKKIATGPHRVAGRDNPTDFDASGYHGGEAGTGSVN